MMSRSRREELAEEAIAQIEWSELGLAVPVGSGLTQPAEANPYGDRSLHYFAYSYTRAFELLWDHVVAGRSETVCYPMLAICRHSIELWLKVAISAVIEGDPPPGHRLKALWTELMGALHDRPPASVADVFATLVWPIVSEIDEHDRAGDRFRYPSNSRFESYAPTDTDLDRLFRSHWLITIYCDAVHTQMKEEGEVS